MYIWIENNLLGDSLTKQNILLQNLLSFLKISIFLKYFTFHIKQNLKKYIYIFNRCNFFTVFNAF